MDVRAEVLNEVSSGSWRQSSRIFRDAGCKAVDERYGTQLSISGPSIAHKCVWRIKSEPDTLLQRWRGEDHVDRLSLIISLHHNRDAATA
jgi:hypothetical protein